MNNIWPNNEDDYEMGSNREQNIFNLTSLNRESEDKMVTYGGERRTKSYTNGDEMETKWGTVKGPGQLW